MKRNIKKLSVLVGVPVIALFIMVVIASAGPAIPYGIKGLYAVTGFSSCSPTGLGIMEATYAFNNDGSGSVSDGVVRNIDASGGWSANLTFNFTYTVTKEGRIEFAYPSGGINVFLPDGTYLMTWDGGPSHGVISPDDKTITISCGPPVYLMVLGPDGKPLPGTETFCITTLAGMRIK
jgi:hypothetical protein